MAEDLTSGRSLDPTVIGAGAIQPRTRRPRWADDIVG